MTAGKFGAKSLKPGGYQAVDRELREIEIDLCQIQVSWQ